MSIGKVEAIQSLKPKAEWTLQDDSLTWLDGSQSEPTTAEINAEVIRLQAVYDGQEYARLRKAKYNLLCQFEMQFDDKVNSTTTWVDAINTIKNAHPTP